MHAQSTLENILPPSHNDFLTTCQESVCHHNSPMQGLLLGIYLLILLYLKIRVKYHHFEKVGELGKLSVVLCSNKEESTSLMLLGIEHIK